MQNLQTSTAKCRTAGERLTVGSASGGIASCAVRSLSSDNEKGEPVLQEGAGGSELLLAALREIT